MEELNKIINQINAAKQAYYNSGSPIMSDWDYDRLLEKARKLGYTEDVGASPVDNIEKIEHEHPMLSLDKIHSIDEIKKFLTHGSVAMWKADGLTISATYIDGVLTRLETRGDGKVGNDIMFHAKSIENLPIHINKTGKYVIDGECVILYSDFEEINKTIKEENRYRNPRNLAAGSLNLLDPTVSKKRHLKFYAWDVIEGVTTSSLLNNLHDAAVLGFDIVDCTYLYEGRSSDDISSAVNMLRESAKRAGFPIDGIVIKYDDIKYRDSLGSTEHHFRNAQAYKFEDERVGTKLKSVTWQIGKTGQLTPVAEFDPVIIDGTVVEKASLHNISIMNQLGLTNGCTCYVIKANQIIPQIDCCEPDGNGFIDVPTRCPICGAPTRIVKENSSEVLYCANDDCSGKLLGKWVTFASKKGMDINGLSEATLEKFLQLGFLDHVFVNIYYLGDYRKDLYKIEGFGKKSIDNLLDAIEASRDVDLMHFLCAFSIPNVGEGQSKLICSKFKTFEEFRDACNDGFHFDTIPGIGPILNANIHKWWANNDWQMEDVAREVRFKKEEVMNKPEGNYPLAGKTFVITGSVYHFKNRNELQAKIESLGGKVVGSVSKNTNYLINNDTESSSSKNKKAKELGVPIIAEENFLKIIN